MQSNNTRI